MSNLVQHHPCSKCGSSDANAEYDDGHFFCFSCRKPTPAKITSLEGVARVLKPKERLDWNKLPFDAGKNYSPLALKWLKRYGLTNEEINANLLWSDYYEMLLFPFYGETTLLCWQGRYFPARDPKVYTAGYPDRHILVRGDYSSPTSTVVVVEDSISSIKVSRVLPASELLGANLSRHKAVGLSRIFDNLIIWLDADKVATAIKFKETYGILFKSIRVIYTDKDPKEYSTEQLKEILK